MRTFNCEILVSSTVALFIEVASSSYKLGFLNYFLLIEKYNFMCSQLFLAGLCEHFELGDLEARTSCGIFWDKLTNKNVLGWPSEFMFYSWSRTHSLIIWIFFKPEYFQLWGGCQAWLWRLAVGVACFLVPSCELLWSCLSRRRRISINCRVRYYYISACPCRQVGT